MDLPIPGRVFAFISDRPGTSCLYMRQSFIRFYTLVHFRDIYIDVLSSRAYKEKRACNYNINGRGLMLKDLLHALTSLVFTLSSGELAKYSISYMLHDSSIIRIHSIYIHALFSLYALAIVY